MYSIEFKKSVKKDLKGIDKSKLKVILRNIANLKSGIEGNENVKKLKGDNPYYRLRTVDYRIIFEIKDDLIIIIVVKIGHRKEVYKRLK